MRKITLIGSNVQYIEHKGAATPDDNRKIVMKGEYARYEEIAFSNQPHFPQTSNEEEGKRLYDFLINGNYIKQDTSLAVWLFTMGYSNEQPAEVKPIVWCKTKETAQVMLRGVFGELIKKKELSVSRMFQLTEQCFITQDGKPLKLAKPRNEISQDFDLLRNFFRPFPT